MIIPYSGVWKFKRIPTKASTAYTLGQALYNDGTDNVPLVATAEDALYIVREAKASAANTNPILVATPVNNNSLALADVGTGTVTAAMVGRLIDPDDSNPSTAVDLTASTEGTFRIEKCLVAQNKVLVSFTPQKR